MQFATSSSAPEIGIYLIRGSDDGFSRCVFDAAAARRNRSGLCCSSSGTNRIGFTKGLKSRNVWLPFGKSWLASIVKIDISVGERRDRAEMNSWFKRLTFGQSAWRLSNAAVVANGHGHDSVPLVMAKSRTHFRKCQSRLSARAATLTGRLLYHYIYISRHFEI